MAVLGLRFHVRAFSSCSKWGPLFIAVRGPLTIVASLVVEHRLQTRRLSNCGSRGPVAPRHVGSSQTRARTRVPCIGRQTLNHCATREAPLHWFFKVSPHLDSATQAGFSSFSLWPNGTYLWGICELELQASASDGVSWSLRCSG